MNRKVTYLLGYAGDPNNPIQESSKFNPFYSRQGRVPDRNPEARPAGRWGV